MPSRLSFTVQEGTVLSCSVNVPGKSTTVKILTTLAQADSESASVATELRTGCRSAPRPSG